MHHIVHIKMLLMNSVLEELSFSKAHPQNIPPHWKNERYSNHAERHRHGHTTVCKEFIRVERILLQHIIQQYNSHCPRHETFSDLPRTVLIQKLREYTKVTIHANGTASTGVFGFRTNASRFLSTCLLTNMNCLIGNKLFSAEFERACNV